MKLRFSFLFLFLLPFLASAQETKKSKRGLGLWPEIEAVYLLYPQGYFYLNNQWRYSSDEFHSQADPHSPYSSFEDIRFTLGYEQELGEQWRLGLAERLSFQERMHRFYTRVNLRHQGKIGSLAFVKRAHYEHIRTRDINPSPNQSKTSPENRFLVSASLEKPFKIKESQFSFLVDAQLLFQIDPVEKNSGPGPRRVDRSRLTAELSYFPSPHFTVSAYAMRQTEYYNALGGSVVDSLTGTTITQPDYKFNQILPVIGLRIRYNINFQEIYPTRYDN